MEVFCNRGRVKLVSGGDGRYRRGSSGGVRSRARPPAAAPTKERKRKRVTVHISQCIHPRAQNLKGLSRDISRCVTTRKAFPACSEAVGRRQAAAGAYTEPQIKCSCGAPTGPTRHPPTITLRKRYKNNFQRGNNEIKTNR